MALYGPGDVIGVDPRAIVRTDPRDQITNFEPNYLPCIEFYDEDFPWRYSPAVPDPATGRLRPWLALIVLTDDEFDRQGHPAGRPLPFIELTSLATLPPLGRARRLGARARQRHGDRLGHRDRVGRHGGRAAAAGRGCSPRTRTWPAPG